MDDEYSPPIGGSWIVTAETPSGVEIHRMKLRRTDGNVIGRSGDLRLEGQTNGSALILNATLASGTPVGVIRGTLRNKEMSGSFDLADGPSVNWTAKNDPQFPNTTKVVNFEPSCFPTVFSAGVSPVLSVFPGDTVRTWCLDSDGFDSTGTRRVSGGLPLTGPFYVHGAHPGDTLAVRFDKVRLNRNSARGGTGFNPICLHPTYLTGDAREGPALDGQWHLDLENEVGFLIKPSQRLRAFKPPLAPAIGCVGVAPSGQQAQSSGACGSYGGDLDLASVREGTTLYLPVYHSGALFSLGDGHAIQGDAEVGGDALETSMEVEFSVSVTERENSPALRMPRAETPEFLLALGVTGSVFEALQIATTELARWLEEKFNLDRTEAAVVLGALLRYEIAKFSPRAVVAAKVSKAQLQGL